MCTKHWTKIQIPLSNLFQLITSLHPPDCSPLTQHLLGAGVRMNVTTAGTYFLLLQFQNYRQPCMGITGSTLFPWAHAPYVLGAPYMDAFYIEWTDFSPKSKNSGTQSLLEIWTGNQPAAYLTQGLMVDIDRK